MPANPTILHLLIGLSLLGQGDPPAVTPPDAKPESTPRMASGDAQEFAPGVRISWAHRHVELDARVILREGTLELLACSPRTREHESIFVVPARPMHMFQAMGLIGLEPGRPVQYSEELEQWVPAIGQPISLRVLCDIDGVQRDIPPEQLVRDTSTRKPPSALRWVFAGSRTLKNGRFAADLEGTLFCVVDFDSALVSLDSLHTADDDFLWLEANTDAIPPVGTSCTLIVSAGPRRPDIWEIHLRPDGSLQQGEKLVTPAELATSAGIDEERRNQIRIVLIAPADASADLLKRVRAELVAAGFQPEHINYRRQKPEVRTDSPADSPAP